MVYVKITDFMRLRGYKRKANENTCYKKCNVLVHKVFQPTRTTRKCLNKAKLVTPFQLEPSLFTPRSMYSGPIIWYVGGFERYLILNGLVKEENGIYQKHTWFSNCSYSKKELKHRFYKCFKNSKR